MSRHPDPSPSPGARDPATARRAERQPKTPRSQPRTPQMGEGQHGPAQPIRESDWIGPNGARDRDQD